MPRRVGDVEGHAVLSDGWDTPRCAPLQAVYSQNTETMRCRGVGGEEVGVKCDCMQGCCECARTGMRVWWCVMQVAVSTKTNRFGAATRQS